MHLVVNALSIGSMSGNHVVYGFLRPVAEWFRGEHRISVLHYENSPPPNDLLENDVRSVPVGESVRHWFRRTLWESVRLPSLLRTLNADALLMCSGAAALNCSVPQITLCQNPWCFIPAAQQGTAQKAKAWIQRKGYGRAFRNSEMMIYISEHLRSLYRADNPGITEKAAEIAWVGLNSDTYESAAEFAGAEREPYSIVSVSAMAPWKGARTLVEAVKTLRDRDIPATLRLVGPWPDSNHESEVRALIEQSGLSEAVRILGKVSDEELHRLYAVSRVFCLLSSCESFGIPAAEAMCFGTPVVSTDCCAVSEVCAGAGRFGPPSNAAAAADDLAELLTNESAWAELSAAARQRSELLHWERCAAPFRRIPELVAGSNAEASATRTKTTAGT